MDKLYKEAIQRLTGEYISKVKCCDECFAESFCIEQQRREGRLPCKDKFTTIFILSTALKRTLYTRR